MRSPIAALGFSMVVCAFTTLAHAQSDPRAQAREHVSRGIGFFDEGLYDAALAEFDEAYRLAPNPGVLYNLARVRAMQGDAVRAVDLYQRYLETATDLTDPRRREVSDRLEEQRARIGRVWLSVNIAGAQIVLDGVLLTDSSGEPLRSPLTEPIRVHAGTHRIGARAPHFEASERTIEVAGRTEQTLSLELASSAPNTALLRIESALEDVALSIDDRVIGVTPFEHAFPLNVGPHRLIARRPGYRTFERTLELSPGAEHTVRVDLSADPSASPVTRGRLEFVLPDVPRRIAIDRDGIDGAQAIELPAGVHRVRVEVAERIPVDLQVEVPSEDSIRVAPRLSWTPEARARKLATAHTQELLGWAGTIAGGVLLASLGPAFVHGQREVDRLSVAFANADRRERACIAACLDVQAEVASLGEQLTGWEAARSGFAVGASLGLGLLVAGITTLMLVPSEAQIDAEAGATLSMRGGSLGSTFHF